MLQVDCTSIRFRVGVTCKSLHQQLGITWTHAPVYNNTLRGSYSTGVQYIPPPAAVRPGQSPAERSNLPMAPPPPRQSTAGGTAAPPPPPPPPPVQPGPAVKASNPQLSASHGQNARGPAPPPPPPPPPHQNSGSMRGNRPPPPPPPRGQAGQPLRAPPPPSRSAQLSTGDQQVCCLACPPHIVYILKSALTSHTV